MIYCFGMLIIGHNGNEKKFALTCGLFVNECKTGSDTGFFIVWVISFYKSLCSETLLNGFNVREFYFLQWMRSVLFLRYECRIVKCFSLYDDALRFAWRKQIKKPLLKRKGEPKLTAYENGKYNCLSNSYATRNKF